MWQMRFEQPDKEEIAKFITTTTKIRIKISKKWFKNYTVSGCWRNMLRACVGEPSYPLQCRHFGRAIYICCHLNSLDVAASLVATSALVLCGKSIHMMDDSVFIVCGTHARLAVARAHPRVGQRAADNQRQAIADQPTTVGVWNVCVCARLCGSCLLGSLCSAECAFFFGFCFCFNFSSLPHLTRVIMRSSFCFQLFAHFSYNLFWKNTLLFSTCPHLYFLFLIHHFC